MNLKVFRDGINRTQNAGSYFQVLTGLNGVGQTFLLETVVSLAIKDGLAVALVEFTAADRICDNEGATRRLLTRLLSELRFGGDSTASGLVQLLDQLCAVALNGNQPSPKEVRKLIEAHCQALLLQPGGDDVVKVLSYYAQHAGDLGRQVKAIKWFRAEYDSIKEAKKDLGVSSIVDNGDFLKHLTTVSTLCRLAGKRGLLVILDEFTVLVRSLHKSVRQANFDTILNAYNSSADARSQGLGFMLAGTPDCLDPRQAGLLSHPALASRLKHTSGPKGMVSSGPILELGPLRPVELFVVLQKARRLVLVHDAESRLPDIALEYFLDRCLSPLGAQEFLAPRDVMQGFAALVQSLEADPSSDWRKAIGAPLRQAPPTKPRIRTRHFTTSHCEPFTQPHLKHEHAFQLLHPDVRRVIYELGWTNLRPGQAMAIDAFFKTGDDQLIIAPTAGGKTECWALPALSTLIDDPQPSIQVLCVSPLRALINDQFARLSDLAKYLGVPVHRWHSDVDQHHKQALRKNPRGILIVTPESLEAALMNRSGEIPKLYRHLKLVVIDEVHALLDEERGVHLASLLSRLFQLIDHRPRHIGLSATIGDLGVAQRFLNPDLPKTVKVIRQDDDGRELQLKLSAYLHESAN